MLCKSVLFLLEEQTDLNLRGFTYLQVSNCQQVSFFLSANDYDSCAGTGRWGRHWVTMKPAECMAVPHRSLCWGVEEGIRRNGSHTSSGMQREVRVNRADGSIASHEREEE